VPVGKRIIVSDDIGWNNDFHFDFGNDINDWNWRNDYDGYAWDHNVEYIMRENGLKRVHEEIYNDDNNSSENQQQDEQPADTTHKDSSRYHYEPTNTKYEIPDKKVKVTTIEEKTKALKISDVASTFFERLSL
jgi:hypothetical protein